MTRPKSTPKKPFLVVRSHTLTREADILLQQLNQEASDALGWTVSSSAMIRALIRQAGKQPTEWVIAELYPLIEQEIASGLLWGSKKK